MSDLEQSSMRARRARPLSGYPFKDILRAEADYLDTQHRIQTRLIKNNSEKGAAREFLIRDFLRRHLPARFGIGRGQILKAAGTVSPQQDLIIFDSALTPLIDHAESSQSYPIETCLAAVEVKSSLTSANVRRFVEVMEEIADGSPAVIRYPDKHKLPPTPRFSIPGVLFAFDTRASVQSLAETLYTASIEHEYPPLVLTICILNKGVIHFRTPGSVPSHPETGERVLDSRPWGDKREPMWLTGTDAREDALGLFFTSLYDLVGIVAGRLSQPVLVPDLTEYLHVRANIGVFDAEEIGESRMGTMHPSWS